jgi:transcriptional regulator with XRE-family HTH domain
METIEQRVLKVRKELGLSQTEFASILSLSHGSISRWETGRDPISEQNIKMIILTLNVSEAWLRTGKGEMFDPVNNDPLIKEVVELMSKMDEPERLVVLNYVRWYTGQQQTLRDKTMEAAQDAGEKRRPHPIHEQKRA